MIHGKRTPLRQLIAAMMAVVLIAAAFPPRFVQAEAASGPDRLITGSYTSSIMGKDLTYRVYLPEGYEKSDQRYPTVYLLHEESASSQRFADDGIGKLLDQWTTQGLMQKMIVVMPDTDENSWFVNKPGAAWEDVIVNELIPSIDTGYRTIPLAKYRGISGVSMGGYGAFVLGLKHPELFGSIASHMGALNHEEGGVSPLALIKSKTVDELKAYQYYLDGGADDPLTYATNSTNDIHAYFRSKEVGVAHEYQMRPGGHTRDYYLKYLDRSFETHSQSFGAGLVSGNFTATPQAINIGQSSVEVQYTLNLDRSSVTQFVYEGASNDAFRLVTHLEVQKSDGAVLYSDSDDLGDVVTASSDSSFSGSFTIPVSALGQEKSYNLTLESGLLGSTYSLGTKPLIQVTPTGTQPEDIQIDLLGDWYFTKDSFPTSTVNGITPDLENGDWRVVQPGLDWWTEGFGGYTGMNNYLGAAWYYRTFTVPADFRDEDLTLLAGKIDDADQTYVNGQLVAETGFENGKYTTSFWAASREYKIPSGLLKRGETNTISIKIYNQNGGGGWYAGPVGIYTKAALQKVKNLPSHVPADSVVAGVKALAEKQFQAISEKDFKTYRDTLSPNFFEKGSDKLRRIDAKTELVKGYDSVKAQVESDYVFELDGKYMYTANLTLTGKDAAGKNVTIQQGAISQYYQYKNGVLKETGDQKLFYVTEFYSESTQRTLKYRVYLPASYLKDPNKRYPSVYLLHQFNSDSESFEIDKIDQILDNGIAEGSIDDMIVIIPDSSGMSWWTNGKDGVKWQDMVTKDLVPLIDKSYRTIDDSRFRGVSGVSMGGFGSVSIGLQSPDLFSSIATHMGAFGYPMLSNGSSPLVIALNYPIDALKRYSLYLDSGNLDVYSFELSVNTLHKYLMDNGVSHYAEIRDGAHDSAFYTKSIGISFAKHSDHFASANVSDGVLNGTVELRTVNGSDKLVYTLNSNSSLTAYADTIPASPYLVESKPSLRLPITVEVINKNTGEKLYSYQDFAAARDEASFTGEFTLPERLRDGSYEIVLKSAVLDRSFELSKITYKVGSNNSGSDTPTTSPTAPTPSTSQTTKETNTSEQPATTVNNATIKKALNDQSALQLTATDGGSLRIPYETLKQLSNSVGLDQLQQLKWDVRTVPQAEQADWLNRTASAWKTDLTPAGAIMDLELSAILTDGSERILSSAFTKPVEINLPVNPNLDTERIGVYRLTDNNQLEYVGGTYDAKTGSIRVSLQHFSSYGVFLYEKTFADLPIVRGASRAVEVLSAKHIVKGVSETRFEPNRPVTRAEFAAILVRTLGLNSNGEQLSFKDVPVDSWYYEPIAAAFQAGIISGVSSETFSPMKELTREEMAVMVDKAFRTLSDEPTPASDGLTSFSDESQISDWARSSVNLLVHFGLMNGTSNTTLAPLSKASRAQAAEIVYSLLKRG